MNLSILIIPSVYLGLSMEVLIMNKEKKWEKITELEDFYIEKRGNFIRAVDYNGKVINITKKEQI